MCLPQSHGQHLGFPFSLPHTYLDSEVSYEESKHKVLRLEAKMFHNVAWLDGSKSGRGLSQQDGMSRCQHTASEKAQIHEVRHAVVAVSAFERAFAGQ